MKITRASGLLIFLAALIPTVHARVHTVPFSQSLRLPLEQDGEGVPALAVAIDGDSLIMVLDRAAGRMALLYRRRADGEWAYSRTLLQSTAPANQLRAGLAMKNSLAVINIDGVTTIWEKVSGKWVQGVTDGQIREPGGYAISVKSVLIGSTGCEVDGLIYEKSASGVWKISGRIPAAAGVCADRERDVELNYDFALINDPAGTVHAFRKNGTALNWICSGMFTLQGESSGRAGPLALQKAVGVAPGSTVYQRISGVWRAAGSLMPIDFAMGTGDAQRVIYRDGVLLTVEARDGGPALPYAYVLNDAGKFDHVAILNSSLAGSGSAHDLDISGKTVVVASQDSGGWSMVRVYNLPSPLKPPKAIANNFDARDVSGFEQTTGGGFVLAGNQYNSIYRQSSSSGESHAVLTDSDWNLYEAVSLRVRPTSFPAADSRVGVALHYVDPDNFYYLAFSRSNRVELNRRLNGVTTTLDTAGPMPVPAGGWYDIDFYIQTMEDGQYIRVIIGAQDYTLDALDNSLTHGRVALITQHARADFDNLYATPTEALYLFSNYYSDNIYLPTGRPLIEMGGHWQKPSAELHELGLKQTDDSGLALAIGGAPVDDQFVRASISLDAYGSTQPVPWFGLVARYVDSRNYYYLSVRGSNTLQIRKVANGVTTVLAGTSYTVPAAGQTRSYAISVSGNELYGFVNGEQMVTAIDSDLPQGRFGVGTYRAKATFSAVEALQF
jgi:hypothetical protein